MGKRYGRRGNGRGWKPAGFLAFVVFCYLYTYWKQALLVAAIIGIALLLIHWMKHKKSGKVEENVDMQEKYVDDQEGFMESEHQIYSSKKSFMTDCEKTFFEAFKEIVGPAYTVQPQINLASVVDKDSRNRYRNELFRNIDFGIFDDNYSLLLLIEINDQSHVQKGRVARDNKVHAICEEAGIPLITFWTQYGINKNYIRKRLSSYLPLLAITSQEADNGG